MLVLEVSMNDDNMSTGTLHRYELLDLIHASVDLES